MQNAKVKKEGETHERTSKETVKYRQRSILEKKMLLKEHNKLF